MKDELKDFTILTRKVADYLDSRLNFSSSAINEYQKIWRRVRFFMDSKGYLHYNSEVEKELFRYHFGCRSKRELHTREVRL
ncbi:hypothetical protein [Algoriphagus sp. PAP.12]|uniref:hypothetical protein n=1 Tax=Algoriphagus sp. PAP.12 TaxID=2996678 RepID=UPI00227AA08B|nr:hypothetical protein [Algoriphagus sp. PAP.12]